MKLLLFGSLLTIIMLIALFFALEYWTYRTPNIKISADASAEERIEAISRWLDVLEQQEKFNGTILFARNGDVVFHRNIGLADAAGSRPITDRTSFNLASVTKHFTAFGILLMAKDGLLSRDDPIAKYPPELASYQGITIDHLLYHTSGLPDYVAMSRKRLEPDALFTADLLVAWLAEGDEPTLFPPGEKEEYSNTGYVLLAEIIARVSGMSFADFMSKRVFEPLEMHDTTVVNKTQNTEFLDDRAYGFRRRLFYFGRNIPHDLNHLDGVAGDGNIYASALDLMKWDTALRRGTLLPVEYYAQAYVPGVLIDGEISEVDFMGAKIQSGLGWSVEKMPVVYYHGAWQAFSNLYWRDLDNGTVLVILSNSGFFLRAASIGDKLIDAVDGL